MAFNPHSPAMSPHTSSTQPSLSGKGKVIVWTDWMDQCSAKKMSQLQDFNVLKYMVYMNIITFKGLKFYKVDSLYWPAKQHELKC